MRSQPAERFSSAWRRHTDSSSPASNLRIRACAANVKPAAPWLLLKRCSICIVSNSRCRYKRRVSHLRAGVGWGTETLQQLVLVLSDGRLSEKATLRRAVREAAERAGVMLAFIILDNREPGNSVLDTKSVRWGQAAVDAERAFEGQPNR